MQGKCAEKVRCTAQCNISPRDSFNGGSEENYFVPLFAHLSVITDEENGQQYINGNENFSRVHRLDLLVKRERHPQPTSQVVL